LTRDVHTTAAQRLEVEGQRYTPQRRRLVEILLSAGQPLTIPGILHGHADMKQSSVYRNLAALEQAGVVWRVATDEEYGSYELSEELTRHHHHLICRSCGRVEDVTIPGELEQRIDRTLDRVARKSGFATVAHRLDLIGICRECAAAAGTVPS
jgi:Fur family transcriptional regulator, ferric uptake regulator